MNNLLFQVTAAFAQFERANLKERQMEGIAKAKARGAYKGRKPTIDKAPIIEAYRAGKKKSEIVREFGISRSYLYTVLGNAEKERERIDRLENPSLIDTPKEVDTSEPDKTISEKRPYPNRQPELQFEEEPMTTTEPENNIFSNMPPIEDTAAYREWIDTILVDLSENGLPNDQICYAMMGRGILTPKGKRQWYPIGVQGLLNHIRLKQQEADNASFEIESDPDPEANASKVPTWEDDGYREYTRDMIFQFRGDGMTLNQIVDELTKIGAKTRTGKDRWNIGTVSMILRNEKAL